MATSVQDWEKRENKAMVLLRISVKENIIPHIQDSKNSNEIWVTFKDLHEMKNTNHVLFLKSKILSIRTEENEAVIAFI